MPRLAASDLMESVLAVRQPLSAPICEKPTISFLSAAEARCALPARSARMRRGLVKRLMCGFMILICKRCFNIQWRKEDKITMEFPPSDVTARESKTVCGNDSRAG